MYENIRNAAFAIALMILLPMTMHYGIILATHDSYIYFYSALAFGIICILVGAFLRIEYLGAGLILGGIAGIALGYLHIWHQLTDLVKFISLLLTLGLVIGVILIKLKLKN